MSIYCIFCEFSFLKIRTYKQFVNPFHALLNKKNLCKAFEERNTAKNIPSQA